MCWFSKPALWPARKGPVVVLVELGEQLFELCALLLPKPPAQLAISWLTEDLLSDALGNRTTLEKFVLGFTNENIE